MTDVYVLYAEGVYRHEFLGAFHDLEEAKTAGREIITDKKHDGYHDVVIASMTIGQKCENATHIGYFRKKHISLYGKDTYTDRPFEEHFND